MSLKCVGCNALQPEGYAGGCCYWCSREVHEVPDPITEPSLPVELPIPWTHQRRGEYNVYSMKSAPTMTMHLPVEGEVQTIEIPMGVPGFCKFDEATGRWAFEALAVQPTSTVGQYN